MVEFTLLSLDGSGEVNIVFPFFFFDLTARASYMLIN